MTTQQTQTLAAFILAAKLGMKVAAADSNPNSDSDTWSDGASHWRCTLTRNRRRFTIPFSQGAAHTQPPTIEDVLDCLASDSAGYENNLSFEGWCDEYGYDTDSRKAERTYKAVKRQAASLKRLVGDDLYSALLWNTERL